MSKQLLLLLKKIFKLQNCYYIIIWYIKITFEISFKKFINKNRSKRIDGFYNNDSLIKKNKNL